MGELWSIKDDETEEIDYETTSLFLIGGLEDRHDGDKYKSPYQGYSYIPDYFYHRHNFKTFDKYPSQEKYKDHEFYPFSDSIDYNKLYSPENHPDEEYFCPICKSHNIDNQGWDAKCTNCGYEDTTPSFRGNEALNEYSRSGEVVELSERPHHIIVDLGGGDNPDKGYSMGETTLIDFLKQHKNNSHTKSNETVETALRAHNKAKQGDDTGPALKVNGNEIRPPYDYKLEGSCQGQTIYKLELSDKGIFPSLASVVKKILGKL